MDELKPCPFCGGKADIYDNRNETYSVGAFGTCRYVNPTHYKCFCTKCGSIGAIVKVETGCETNTWRQKEAKKGAIKAWNRRANDG